MQRGVSRGEINWPVLGGRMGEIMKNVIVKKLLVLVTAGTLAFGMAACGQDGEGSSQSSDTSESSTQESDAAQDSGSASDEQGGEDSSESTSEDLGGEESTAPTEDQQGGWSQEMEDLKSAVVEALGENYWPNMPLDAEILEATFGVTSEMYDDFMGEMPMISNNVDTLLIIKAKEGQVDAVEEALTSYRDARLENLMEYPMNVGKVQACRIEKVGNYVLYVLLGGDTMTVMDEEGDEAVLSYCMEVNDQVIEIISQKQEQ